MEVAGSIEDDVIASEDSIGAPRFSPHYNGAESLDTLGDTGSWG